MTQLKNSVSAHSVDSSDWQHPRTLFDNKQSYNPEQSFMNSRESSPVYMPNQKITRKWG